MSYWCMSCDGAECGPLETYKCYCGHYAGAHTDVRPANAKAHTGGPQSNSEGVAAGAKAGQDACPKCKKAVFLNEAAVFEGVKYHTKCYRCSNKVCNNQMFQGREKAFEGKPYCSQMCTTKKAQAAGPNALNPRAKNGLNCHVCGTWLDPTEPIVTSRGKKYHKACVPGRSCHACGKPVAGKVKVDGEGHEYHPGCVGKVPCPVCGEGLTGYLILIDGIKMHATCLKCKKCKTPCSQAYMKVGDDYFCEGCDTWSATTTTTTKSVIRHKAEKGPTTTVEVHIVGGKSLVAKDGVFRATSSDPYVKVYFRNCELMKTRHEIQTLNPTFNVKFELELTWDHARKAELVFEIWDWDMFTPDDSMGEVRIPLSPQTIKTASSAWLDKCYTVKNNHGCNNASGLLQVKTKAYPKQK